MMPSLFIAHGAPTLAIEGNEYTRALQELSMRLPRPKGILLFSAHWESGVQEVSTVEQYDTIHDFGGFPRELYEIVYPAKGERVLAETAANLLTKAGVPIRFNGTRGLDHGAWVVLRLLYPQADIPVVSMSVNPGLTPEQQYGIGKALSGLRSQGILIIGSGGTVHNFATMRFRGGDSVDQWAVEFEEWLAARLVEWDLPALCQYRSLAPHADLAVPRHASEHFIPLLYAMGAADDERTAKRLHLSFQMGNLSHSIWQFGTW
jgi:4,5-DOPA dioxygenase extradiol